jgi:hypothetical protein
MIKLKKKAKWKLSYWRVKLKKKSIKKGPKKLSQFGSIHQTRNSDHEIGITPWKKNKKYTKPNKEYIQIKKDSKNEHSQPVKKQIKNIWNPISNQSNFKTWNEKIQLEKTT